MNTASCHWNEGRGDLELPLKNDNLAPKFYRLSNLKNYLLFTMIAYGAGMLPGTAKAQTTDTILATALQPLGRTIIDGEGDLDLVTSGAHFGFSFEGPSCAIYVKPAYAKAHTYLQYELDGVYQKKIRIEGSSSAPVIIQTNHPGQHRIWIYKVTEATTGAIVFSKIAARKIKPISIPDGPLIEFIGNSITCGADADPSDAPCGTGEYQDHHNAYFAYGPRVARALHANYILSSVSGIGVYRTWNKENPSMPAVYENTNFQAKDTLRWKFDTYAPTIVSIALGTNDMSLGDGTPRAAFDSVRFVGDYVKFVQLVKSKYPHAKIALLSSPMIKGASREILQRCLTRIKEGIDASYPADKPVATFFFQPMDPHGCDGHPNVEDHQILAEALEPFFAKLLKL
jgi:lysophospholipase L1-like esterase